VLFLLVTYKRNKWCNLVLFSHDHCLFWCWHVHGVETFHWSIITDELQKTW